MSAKNLMILGAIAGSAFCILGAMAPTSDLLAPMFGAGMLFGKGYGIFEVRSRKEPDNAS